MTFSSCLESPDMTVGIVNGKEMPTVLTKMDTPSLQSNHDGNILFQGEITSDGKAEITEKGFYWSTVNNNPGIADSIVVVSNESFLYNLVNASGSKTYYWRAYAKNSYGYDYGEVNSCKTPAIWEEKDSLSTNSRGRGAIFTVNDKIYITCGELSGSGRVPVKETWEYSITSGKWNINYFNSFPGDYRIDPVVFTIGNYSYVGTGWKAAGEIFKDFYKYDENSNPVWTEIKTPDSLDARYGAAAFSLNGRGYLLGGYSSRNGVLNDVWQYNPDEDNWERKNDFPVKFYGGISICNNSRVFAGFGETGTARILWEYNPVADSWSEFAYLPDEIKKKIYSGVIIQNTIYIVDGNNQIWTLNLSDKTWKKKTDLPSKFLNADGEGGYQTMLVPNNSNSIYIGLGFSKYLFEYRPLWDN